jgi:molybdopterin-containing oxidoreductase family iron-sulfur binding subunit
MSNHDQCPSSVKEGLGTLAPRTAHELVGSAGSGRAYWRGLDDLADTPEFREHLEREFPSGASELLDGSRRTFLKLMGAGLALAGAVTIPGCRRPDHKILPYSKNVPEDVIPGKAVYYATSMCLPGGGAEGLLVECHEGRPTKIEGNPLHPNNQGKSSLWSQACVLNMYDPDRLVEPTQVVSGQAMSRTVEDFPKAFAPAHFKALEANKGAGLAIIVDKKTSPSRDAMRDAVKARFPQAMWIAYDALDNRGAIDGGRLAFGRAVRAVYSFAKAKVVLSLDDDFTNYGPMALTYARDFANTRRVSKVGDSMSRLYMAESCFTNTGSLADHRRRMSPSQVSALLLRVASGVLEARAVAGSQVLKAAVSQAPTGSLGSDDPNIEQFVKAIIADLCDGDNAGKSAITIGASQPAWAHAIVAALNQVLGNVGKTVQYAPMSDEEASDGAAGLKALCEAIDAGKVSTIVTIDANPVYNAPAELDFATKFKKVAERITLSVEANETVEASTWRLNGAHLLESWGDTRSIDGTIAPTQPMIAPLYAGMSELELLALIGGYSKTVGYEIVREVWRKSMATLLPKAEADFETLWRRALHNGVLTGASVNNPADASVAMDKIAQGLVGVKLPASPSGASLEVAFRDSHNRDGRWLNNAWLQELPEPASRIVWDNAAFISPGTAKALGLMQSPTTDKKPAGRVAELKVGNRTMRIACWAVPGVPDNTVVLPLGYGREVTGLVGTGVGFNTFSVRTSDAMWSATGATLSPVGGGDKWYEISCTQTHWSMEGRAIARAVDLPAWNNETNHPQNGKAFVEKDSYGRTKELNFAERLEGGELSHMPTGVAIYNNPFNKSEGDGFDPSHAAETGDRQKPNALNAFAKRSQWGMTIDLSTCTGCNVCTIACQAENNIPVVGKIEVNKGREMSWIRVDRYFVSSPQSAETVGKGRRDVWDDPELAMMYQPVACVHCENAPCETVCPVNATVHGPEGHNYMVYNRCIGTRYCANNCPYKVRRFNFFDYGVTKFNGGLAEPVEEIVGTNAPLPKNHNLIPPRLRKKLDEISKMQKNPNVTVRSRGVMEKCSYCIQRTNEAKIEVKLQASREGRKYNHDTDGLPDMFVQTACQQACPTNSIVFGDIEDKVTVSTKPDGKSTPGSMVSYWRDHQRAYLLLGYIKTRPRTSHLIRVNNPNNTLLASVDGKRLESQKTPFGSHGGHDSHGGGGEHAPAGGGHGGGHSFIDRNKSGRDGYLLSLPVLGAQA